MSTEYDEEPNLAQDSYRSGLADSDNEIEQPEHQPEDLDQYTSSQKLYDKGQGLGSYRASISRDQSGLQSYSQARVGSSGNGRGSVSQVKAESVRRTSYQSDDALYDPEQAQEERLRELLLNTRGDETEQQSLQPCIRNAGAFRVDVSSTKFCIEVKPPAIEGPMYQENVLGELFSRLNFENQAKFLSTAILYWKCSSVEDGIRAAIEILMQKGCQSFPARSSIVFRLIQNLRKLYNSLDDTDKALCMGLRELLTASLIAETTRVAPISALLRHVDGALPELPTPGRRAMITALGRYHEEAARTFRIELNALKQRSADIYRAYREKVTQARRTIAEACPVLKKHPATLQHITDLYLTIVSQCRTSRAALRMKQLRRSASRISNCLRDFLQHRQLAPHSTPLTDAERGVLVEYLTEALQAMEASPVIARAREEAARQTLLNQAQDKAALAANTAANSQVPEGEEDELSEQKEQVSGRPTSAQASMNSRISELGAASEVEIPTATIEAAVIRMEDSIKDRYVQMWRGEVTKVAVSLPSESQRQLIAELMADQLRALLSRQREDLALDRKDSVDRIKYMKAKLRDARDLLLPPKTPRKSVSSERRNSDPAILPSSQETEALKSELHLIDEETRQRVSELIQDAVRELLELEDAEDEADVQFTIRRLNACEADLEEALMVLDNTADEHFYSAPQQQGANSNEEPMSQEELEDLRLQARQTCEELLSFAISNDEATMLRDTFVERLTLEYRLDGAVDDACFNAMADNDALTHREIIALAEASQSAAATAAAASAAAAAAARITQMYNDRAIHNRNRVGYNNAKFQEFEWGQDEWYVDADIDSPEIVSRATERLWTEYNKPDQTLITGIYTWSPTLESIARQDIFLRRGVSKATAELARRALRQSRELYLSYVAYTDILKQLYNPFKTGQQHWAEAFKDEAGEHCFRPQNMEHEDKFTEGIQLYPKETAVSDVAHLVNLVESDRIKLHPGPYSGHNDRVQYAIESLINLDAMSAAEKEKIDRGQLYMEHNREYVSEFYSHERPQHRVTMQPGADQMHVDVPVTELTLRPALTIEPQPRSYLRRALAIRRLRLFLLQTFGRDVLMRTNRPLRAAGLLQRIEMATSGGDIPISFVLGGAPSVQAEAVLSEVASTDHVSHTAGRPALADLEQIEEITAGAYYLTCEELGLTPVNLVDVMAEEDEAGLGLDDGDDGDKKRSVSSAGSDVEGDIADDGHGDCFRDPEGAKIHLRQWVLAMPRDPDIGLDMRCVNPISRHSEGDVKALGFIGFARKRVMVLFRSIPRVLNSFASSYPPVYPTTKEDDQPDVLYFTCPKCQWELAVPQLDASGAFKCSGDPCAQQPDDLLICLPDGGIIPATLQLDEYWLEYPVFVPLVLGRVWRPDEFRVVCNMSRDESEIVRSTTRVSTVREKLGGIQAQVPYEIIEELNAWFKDIDRKGKGQLSRAVLAAYFTGGGGETGFYTGDTMFYYMDRNQDGWVGLPEFRYAILNIYKKDLAVLRVEKIRNLRQKFNDQFKQYWERVNEERKARERREQFKQRKEQEKYQQEFKKRYQELMLRAAAVGGLSDSEEEEGEEAEASERHELRARARAPDDSEDEERSISASSSRGSVSRSSTQARGQHRTQLADSDSDSDSHSDSEVSRSRSGRAGAGNGFNIREVDSASDSEDSDSGSSDSD